MNPLLSPYATPHQTTPFEEIKNEHYLSALNEAIKITHQRLNAIKQSKDEASFENTIEAAEMATLELDTIDLLFHNTLNANTNEELQKIAKDFAPQVSAFKNDMILDEELFLKVKSVYDKRENLKLNVEQKMLLHKMYKEFVRNGALLSQDKKEKLREIDKEIAGLGLEFSDHVLNDTNNYELHIENEKDLAGIPEGIRESAKMTALQKKKEGWVFTLQMPSMMAFLRYADNRELRERMMKLYAIKCMRGDQNDNQEIVKRIAFLRNKRAHLLGYETHAHFVLEERMALKPERVMNFLDDLYEKAMPFAKKDMQNLSEFSKSLNGPSTIEFWDYAYYAEKLKKEKFDIDDEILRPYFKLENVAKGMFEVANKLYGLQFKEVQNISKYHPEVKTYEVFDQNNKFMAVFYTDFFPRESKKGGAWMTEYRSQRAGIRPQVAIVCNFTKPTETKPSLLTFDEVTTMFHEFGHALHGMLSDCQYRTLASPNVYWDFVELPSQIMENWCYEKECLDLFASHYETGEKIPQEYIDRIKASSTFHEGRHTIRQLAFAYLDMAWHAADPSTVDSVESFENKVSAKTQLCPLIKGSSFSTSFGHIFPGGYSSGYYSYKWAEVLDADAFEYFKEKGIFNCEVANSFRHNILARGGSEHPEILYKKFRGREPRPEALLQRSGLIVDR